ncbi:ABC transporter ATP-binding protein [Nonomuraea sediminis]|uniref:ABC transporter ATP-binding protein n=1 Tax=Nonomuraea sediminis TaxID=2835864 RepID=UPI001BDCCF04|nr:oligopeptide/dipeptide ABC transporter ATP-binding protein [Nonomuraea sediminis]
MAEPVLHVEEVTKSFRVHGAAARAVAGVSLQIAAGETLGLVGESGSGKSTLARLAIRLAEPDGGRIALDGRDITHLPRRRLRGVRRQVQMVFQDPYASLDSRMTVGGIIAEPLRSHRTHDRAGARERVAELLETVGLRASDAGRHPHAFSGGQRQRIAIARALALQPRLVILDEPVSALDVSIQAQILRLLSDLQQRLGLAYLFITHDLHVARRVAHRIAVMHLGRIVETGTTAAVFGAPRHPYTQALLSAVPSVGERGERIVLRGEVPSVTDPPSGCAFRTRCRAAQARCAEEEPILSGAGHASACHFPL